MNEGEPSKSTKDSAHGEEVANRKGLLVEFDKEKAEAHYRNGNPCEYPNDDKCWVCHFDWECGMNG